MSSESADGGPTQWTWEVATDASEAHALLCASDGHQAARYGMTAPVRSLDTTARRVRAGSVHLLRHGAEAAASFTLSPEPPHGMDLSVYPPAASPVYLQRLAVAPAHEGSIVGLRCLRRAVELAHERGADVLRCEANPDLQATRRMLDALGFTQHGPTLAENGVRRVHLQKIVAE
ncbi:GNAT family N-acetyltransferase [Micromonospora okii]|uniref:GNAT family N-acetyltransferase n=1 Tax=Micromonospora okii TaxID=1182970 RepID=UPI001E3F730F|nr:GNAT family N-acetyltransferase [Micromonospora okii]